MKIVQNSNRWLKKLSRAAALMSLAVGSQSAYSQDGAIFSGATPGGAASEMMQANRSGFGVNVRAGHTAGSTVGRSDSLSTIALSPYFNSGNSLVFGDSRLGRGNEGGLVWSFGSGYRYFVEDWDVVLGGNGYFDRDDLSGTYLNQWGLGAELLANGWEARGNYYQTFGNTLSLTDQSVKSGSGAFQGENLTYTRVDSFALGMKGFDAEAGFLLPGDFSQKIDLRAFGGGYYYEGETVDGFAGWSTRLQADIARWLELGLKVTDDQQFNTTVSFSAIVHVGGFRSEEHLKRSAIQRFREPVRRNLNVVTLVSSQEAPGQLALNPSTGTPFTIAHVNSNDTSGPFLGTVDDPFRSLQRGLSSGTDIVFVHAGSKFTSGPENLVNLVPNQQLIGEGEIVAGRSTQNFVTVSAAGQLLTVELPKSPTFAASPTLDRPDIANSIGNAVVLANGSQFSGFTITNPTVNGIFSNGGSGTIIHEVGISGAGSSAMLLQNTAGNMTISNTSLISAAGAIGPLLDVNGGSGVMTFSSTDAFLLGSIQNSSLQEALVVENMSGGRFTMTKSSVTDNGGKGVVIRNNTGGSATIDNLVSTSALTNALFIENSSGDYNFTKSNPQIAALTATGSTEQAILIDGLTGRATFNTDISIVDRQAGGIEIAGSAGSVTFSNPVTLTDQLGTSTAAGVLVSGNLSGNAVEFTNNLTVTSTAVTAGAAERTNGNGLLISSNAAGSIFRAMGVTTVNGADLESILVSGESGNVDFLGETRVRNRATEGISVTGSSGSVEFGVTNPRRLAQVSNELLSTSAAIELNGNSGVVSFGEATVFDATGNAGGGAGIDIRNNTGLINFVDMDVTSVDGTGFFGLNNRLIRSDNGIVTSTNETAVDIEDSGITMTLGEVNSTDAPDYGIRLVNTNSDEGRTFFVRPTASGTTAGAGGTIIGAKGDGLDNDDAAGIFLSNAGQVEIREMILNDNEFGVRIINTESWKDSSGNVIVVNDRNEQYFLMDYSLVNDSDIRGIHSVDLMGLQVNNTVFDNNGDDAATGYDTIFAQYTTALDDVDTVNTYDRSDRPYEILIQGSDFTSNQHDVIRILQTASGAGAAIRTNIFNNRLEVNDSTDPTTPPPGDTRPLLDDGVYMDWNGPARILVDGNDFDMRAADDQMAFAFSNSSTTDLTELSIQGNRFFINNLGTSNGATSVELLGDYNMGDPDGVFRIANNIFNVAGATPTAMYFVLPPTVGTRLQQALFVNNQITMESDGGTGIEIRRSGNGAIFVFNNNQLNFRDLGTANERGFVITPVNGPVRIGGLDNRMRVISTDVNGNGLIEAPLIIPPGSNIGQVQINGVLFP